MVCMPLFEKVDFRSRTLPCYIVRRGGDYGLTREVVDVVPKINDSKLCEMPAMHPDAIKLSSRLPLDITFLDGLHKEGIDLFRFISLISKSSPDEPSLDERDPFGKWTGSFGIVQEKVCSFRNVFLKDIFFDVDGDRVSLPILTGNNELSERITVIAKGNAYELSTKGQYTGLTLWLKSGINLHLRPALALNKLAQKYSSDIILKGEGSRSFLDRNPFVNALNWQRIMAWNLNGLGLNVGIPFAAHIYGPDDMEAGEAVKKFFSDFREYNIDGNPVD
jgi:phosphotransferase system HPr-like phosphotransfer protein